MPGDLVIGRWRLSHQSIRLGLFLLPVWLFGAGELARFAWSNTVPGIFERNGLIKGGDFVQFYVAGTLAGEGRWSELHDLDRLERAVAQIVPAAAGQVPAPVYGPQVALFFAPFSQLSYVQARWVWLTVSAVAYTLAAAVLLHAAVPLVRYRVLAWMTVVCNPALAMVLATGQTGALAALWWALGALALRRRHLWLVGGCLGLLAYKPSLLLGGLPVLLILNAWAVLAGLIASVVAQSLLTVAITGVEPWRAYVSAVLQLPRYFFLTDTVPHQKQSLAGMYQLLAGPGTFATTLTAISGAIILLAWWRYRGRPLSHPLYALLASTAVLLSPHLYVYDLVVFMPALLIVAAMLSSGGNRSPGGRLTAWAGYAVLLAPLSGAIAAHTHLQLSTLALLGLFAGLRRLCNLRASPDSHPTTGGTVRAERC